MTSLIFSGCHCAIGAMTGSQVAGVEVLRGQVRASSVPFKCVFSAPITVTLTPESSSAGAREICGGAWSRLRQSGQSDLESF